jgi:hypothetical protein
MFDVASDTADKRALAERCADDGHRSASSSRPKTRSSSAASASTRRAFGNHKLALAVGASADDRGH